MRATFRHKAYQHLELILRVEPRRYSVSDLHSELGDADRAPEGPRRSDTPRQNPLGTRARGYVAGHLQSRPIERVARTARITANDNLIRRGP